MEKEIPSPKKPEVNRREFFEKLIAKSVYVPVIIWTFKGSKVGAISPPPP